MLHNNEKINKLIEKTKELYELIQEYNQEAGDCKISLISTHGQSHFGPENAVSVQMALMEEEDIETIDHYVEFDTMYAHINGVRFYDLRYKENKNA